MHPLIEWFLRGCAVSRLDLPGEPTHFLHPLTWSFTDPERMQQYVMVADCPSVRYADPRRSVALAMADAEEPWRKRTVVTPAVSVTLLEWDQVGDVPEGGKEWFIRRLAVTVPAKDAPKPWRGAWCGWLCPVGYCHVRLDNGAKLEVRPHFLQPYT